MPKRKKLKTLISFVQISIKKYVIKTQRYYQIFNKKEVFNINRVNENFLIYFKIIFYIKLTKNKLIIIYFF